MCGCDHCLTDVGRMEHVPGGTGRDCYRVLYQSKGENGNEEIRKSKIT